MNAKKGIITQMPFHLMSPKENDCSTFLIFLNDIKHMYKMNQYWSNTIILDSFFNILNHVVTITRKLSIPSLKSNLTDRQIGASKSSLHKEIKFFFNALQSNHYNPQAKNRDAKSSLSNGINNKHKSNEGPKKKREISNQNIIAKIKEKIKTQTLNNSVSEITQPFNEKHLFGLRALSQTMRHNPKDSWKAPGNITSRNASHYSINWSSTGKDRARSRDKIRETNNYQSDGGDYKEEPNCEYYRDQRERSLGEQRGGKKSRADSKDNNISSDIKLSFYATRLVNQYHNVIHKYYTIKTEEEMKKIKALSNSKIEGNGK